MMSDKQAEDLGRIFDLLTSAIGSIDSNSESVPLLEYALAYTEGLFLNQNEDE